MMEKKKRTWGDFLETAARQGYQGATFGFGDEIIDYPTAVIVAKLTGQKVSDVLAEARGMSKEAIARDWKEAPALSFASNIVGGIPFGLSTGGKALFNTVRNGNLIQGIGQGAKIGAGLGAVSGFGSATPDQNGNILDSLNDRVIGAAGGSAFGAALGGAFAPLARMGTGPDINFNTVTKNVSKNQETGAEQELARLLAARPDLKDQILRAQEMDAAAARTGVPLTLAEKIAQSPTDPLLMTQKTLASNPMTAGRMEALYAARSGTKDEAGQIQKALMSQAERYAGGPQSYDDVAARLIEESKKAANRITSEKVNAARPLYEQAEKVLVDPSILTDPVVGDAVKTVMNNPAYQREIAGGFEPNSVKVLDLAYRAIRDKAQTASQSGDRNMARLLSSASNDLLAKLDEAAPSYAEARAVYSMDQPALQMRQQVGNLAGIDPMNTETVNRSLYSGTPKNAEFVAGALGPESAKLAVASNIYKSMADLKNDPVNLATRIAPDADARQMLRIYGGDKGLFDTLDVINQAKLGEKARFGSITTPLAESNKQMAKAAAGAGLDAISGNNIGLARKAMNILTGATPEENPQFYADMMDLMTTEKGMQFLQKIAGEQGNQIARQELVGSVMRPITKPIGQYAEALSIPATNATRSMMLAPQSEDKIKENVFIDQIQNLPQNVSSNSQIPEGFIMKGAQNKAPVPPGFVVIHGGE